MYGIYTHTIPYSEWVLVMEKILAKLNTSGFCLVSMLICVFNYLHEHIFGVVSVSYTVILL